MKHNREYEIAWQGLKPGPHTYVYDINDRFMQEREVDDSFKDWNAKITLVFDKHENFFMLHFDIDGKVTVPCDRCGELFSLRLWDEFDLVIKLTGDDVARTLSARYYKDGSEILISQGPRTIPRRLALRL